RGEEGRRQGNGDDAGRRDARDQNRTDQRRPCRSARRPRGRGSDQTRQRQSRSARQAVRNARKIRREKGAGRGEEGRLGRREKTGTCSGMRTLPGSCRALFALALAWAGTCLAEDEPSQAALEE